ncbi:tRNA (cytidine(34)-2'-O)-methyltransferase [Pseudochelatococcus sp. G4_1912]|uniref:tRNA (cytidine(34)-2'-O)-methyltransferase n=1 Tax=Pseudochelatococcus sp. G4_1912 TaxID=3114288 RepID=UPI0039C5FD73
MSSDSPLLRLALYQPDIPQNTGTMLRLCACLGIAAEIIEPAGFPVSDRAFRRAGMDYLDDVSISRHDSWRKFEEWRASVGSPRLVLTSTRAPVAHTSFNFQPGDIIMVGRESAGVPEEVHAKADARVIVPLRPGMRSINVAVTAAMVLGEALRQLDGFPITSVVNG